MRLRRYRVSPPLDESTFLLVSHIAKEIAAL